LREPDRGPVTEKGAQDVAASGQHRVHRRLGGACRLGEVGGESAQLDFKFGGEAARHRAVQNRSPGIAPARCGGSFRIPRLNQGEDLFEYGLAPAERVRLCAGLDKPAPLLTHELDLIATARALVQMQSR
jgi:hypothetical protein